MSLEILDASEEVGHLVGVLELYRVHKKTLGFMPEGAFEERMHGGTLLVAADHVSSKVVGYVLYDLPRREIAIRHLCVDRSRRGDGIAKKLVEEVRRRHPERLGIKVLCRNDFEAHGMWPSLDFEATKEVPGRSRDGLPLTLWWLDFGHPTLFSTHSEQAQRIGVALDTDVFIDIFEEREHSDESRELLSDWVIEIAQLVVTKAVGTELIKNKDPEIRRRSRSNFRTFARANSETFEWKECEAKLFKALSTSSSSPHDAMDIQHVARAAAAHLAFFVSRDDHLVNRLQKAAWDLFQLHVLKPGDLLAELWHQTVEPYAPVFLENTSFLIERSLPENDRELYHAFLNTGTGERKSEFAGNLRKLRSKPKEWNLSSVRDAEGKLTAFFVYSVEGPILEVPFLRVSDSGGLVSTIARQIAHILRSQAIQSGLAVIKVTDSAMSVQVTEGLIAESFILGNGQWWLVALDKLNIARTLADDLERMGKFPDALEIDNAISVLRSAPLSAELVADLERRFAPMKIEAAPIPVFLIPIRPYWAEQLFDTSLSMQTLFRRQDKLGISREHVYYSNAASGSLIPPVRILWYVSKDGQRSGTGAIRATSKLEEVRMGRPLDLFNRFSRLGVYNRQKVLEMGRNKKTLMALRFSETELFKQPVPYPTLKTIAEQCNYKLFLRAPNQVPGRMFDIVYMKGKYGID